MRVALSRECLLAHYVITGAATPAESISTRVRSSMLAKKRWKAKTTMASRFSDFTLNGVYQELDTFRSSVSNNLTLSTLCSAEITFKTDPKNTDYAAEHGASRNFEPWREEKAVEEGDRLAKLEEEENNPMKALENRTVDSKREMDILDALQDIRARNARNERVGHSVDMMAQIGLEEIETEEDLQKKLEDEEDEKLVRQVFSKVSMPVAGPSGSGSNITEEKVVTVKRKADGDEPDLHSLLPEATKTLISSKLSTVPVLKKRKTDMKNTLGIKIKKAPAKAAVS